MSPSSSATTACGCVGASRAPHTATHSQTADTVAAIAQTTLHNRGLVPVCHAAQVLALVQGLLMPGNERPLAGLQAAAGVRAAWDKGAKQGDWGAGTDRHCTEGGDVERLGAVACVLWPSLWPERLRL